MCPPPAQGADKTIAAKVGRVWWSRASFFEVLRPTAPFVELVIHLVDFSLATHNPCAQEESKEELVFFQ